MIARPAPDRGQVAFELREALIGLVRIPEPGDAGPDARQRPQRPGQAGQGEPGQEADIVAARGSRDQARVWRDGVQLRGLAGGGRPQDVTGGDAGIVTSRRSSPSGRATRWA